MSKKFLSLALALALCLGLTVPAFADAAYDYTSTMYSEIGGEASVYYHNYSANGYTDPSAENVTFSVAPVGVAKIRWEGPWNASEYSVYVFDQDCVVTRKDGLPFNSFRLPSMYGDVGYSVGMGNEYWTHVEEEWSWVEAGAAGIRVDRDDGWAFQFSPDGEDWSPLMMSKKGLDTVFPFEDTENDTTGTVLEYRPLSTQPTGGPQVSDWAKEQVSKAAETGLVPDSLGSDYRVSVTRAQFAATAVKLYEAMSGQKAPAAGESPFTDTSDPAVIQAQALGIVSGVGDGKFAADALVTREQAAAMLSRVYTKLGGNIPEVADTTFADNGKVSGWAKDAVAFMADKGIVSGVGNNSFDPLGNASIEQALVIALRMFDNLK